MLVLIRLVLATASVLALAACAPSAQWEPRRSATLSDAPGAKGYLIVGFADENAHSEFLSSYGSFGLFFKRLDAQQGALAQRFGCASLAGIGHAESCEGQGKMAYRVLELDPGIWSLSAVSENLIQGFPARAITVKAPFPAGTRFTVSPGAIVYIGDFLFSVDPETQSIVLKRHSRDDAAAPSALAQYPGLRGPIRYEPPVPGT